MSKHSSNTLVSFGGNTVKVISDHSLFTNALQTHFRHCNMQQAEIVATFHVTATSKFKFMGAADGRDLFSNLGFEQALWVVMNEVITRLNADCIRGPVFHAAALAKAEDALILCGKSGSGKSSLAAWLIANGFQYLTDEVIEMPLQGNHIHGLTRSIVLKRDSAFIWKRHLNAKNAQGCTFFEDSSAWIDPVLFHPNAVKTTATPGVLVFPRFILDGSFHAKNLTNAEALFRLMQTLVNARNLPGYGMEAATRLAQQVQAFDMTYSDIEEAADWLKKTIRA